MKKYFLPNDDKGKDEWLSNFSTKLATYATKYGITTAEVTDTVNGYAWFHYWLDYRNKFEQYSIKLTSYKNQIRDGVSAGATAAVVPTPPSTGTLPTAVAPDVFGRAISLAARIKSYQSYSEADGSDLGITGSSVQKDLHKMKPILQLRHVAGHPEIVWTKKNMSGLEIFVSRNNTDYVFLTIDNNPNYIDNALLPNLGQSEVWKYKAIYRYNDERVGEWSDEVSITV